MSAEADFRALLVARPALTALVAQRVALNAVPQGSPLPVVAFTAQHDPQHTLDGNVSLYAARIEAQCWAETGATAQAVADQVQAAVEADNPRRGWVISRGTSYDSQLDLHAEILTVEWWIEP